MVQRHVILLAFLVVSGCTPKQPGPRTWEKIDYDALQARLASPTGHVDADSLSAVTGTLIDTLENMSGLETALSAFFGAMDSQEEQTEASSPLQVVRGPLEAANTAAYARYSCHGPNLDAPDHAFGHGHIRLDSPSLTNNVQFEGHALLSFDNCVFADVTLDGDCPLYYDTPNERVAFSPTVTITTPESSFTLSIDLVFDGGNVVLLLEDSDEDTYVASIAPTEVFSYTMAGSNGSFDCAIDETGAECIAPDGSTVGFTL